MREILFRGFAPEENGKNSIKTLTDSEFISLIRSETKYKIKVHSNLSALLNEAADRLEQKLKGGAGE